MESAFAASWTVNPAKQRSFTKAANDLGVTQSTLSRRIEHLEQQLGVRLFVRTQSGVTLTPEGESILGAAREIEAKILEIQGSLVGADRTTR